MKILVSILAIFITGTAFSQLVTDENFEGMTEYHYYTIDTDTVTNTCYNFVGEMFKDSTLIKGEAFGEFNGVKGLYAFSCVWEGFIDGRVYFTNLEDMVAVYEYDNGKLLSSVVIKTVFTTRGGNKSGVKRITAEGRCGNHSFFSDNTSKDSKRILKYLKKAGISDVCADPYLIYFENTTTDEMKEETNVVTL